MYLWLSCAALSALNLETALTRRPHGPHGRGYTLVRLFEALL
jgi:hypothetical protein